MTTKLKLSTPVSTATSHPKKKTKSWNRSTSSLLTSSSLVSPPQKELFAHNHRHHLNVRVIHLCGGMVDVIAGKTKITPKWIKNSVLPGSIASCRNPDDCSFLSFLWSGKE
ncbi:MAG: WecB/TagA/CpsF family glycosyltransferase [Ignavibacteriales bacterium]|nr:WecB/TagA/CpsF family glycosyltransferase [Ignavibacteriales bacterium]